MGPRTSGTGRQGKPGGEKTEAMAPKGRNTPSKPKSKMITIDNQNKFLSYKQTMIELTSEAHRKLGQNKPNNVNLIARQMNSSYSRCNDNDDMTTIH